ncbi:DUF4395 domain-containing protein [Pseudothauera nasutitermitis]|uniref:DUF4395 domain-containing protein n=1 Tax=Pseudothauera nasutitermitis TaxID=2565930 RepID=A0A4S4ATC6_9RHOO|nr:DUF4395 domain-containing protein [Pseudothauera nasutitermitis]THF63165.1 DUF4395 domain-containing protein [Pseudothauera nasutitermitis]
MLRFDIPPVCSNAYRFQATMTFIVSAIYLFTPYQWAALIIALGGLLRGFVSPHKCLSYRLFASLTRKMGKSKMVNAGSKMFADKIAAIAGTAMVVSWLMGASFGAIPAVALLVFSFIDLSTGFCAACWVYGWWYRVRQPG